MGKLEKIFLVFHDDDNSIPIHEKLGWVDSFKYFLKIIVKQIAGLSLDFQRLENLNPIRKLPDQYLLVIITSKSLFEDKAHSVFLEKIQKKIEHEQISEDKLLKIRKQFFPKHLEPDFLHFFKEYPFYKSNGLSEGRSEYRDFFSNSEEKTFWMKLTDLAYDILAFSEKRSTGCMDLSRHSVFLAEANAPSEKFRNNIRRDLLSMGINVWPKSSCNDDATDFIIKLDQNIKNTDFSVHIVGNSFGGKISGVNHSREEIQAKIAENFSNIYKRNNRGAVYKRFFWFDKAGMLANDKINRFYKELSIKTEDVPGTELIVSSWEEFKSLVYQYVSFELPGQKSKADDPETGCDIVYFLYDRSDEKNAARFIDVLRTAGYMVISSNFDGDIMAVRHIHMESLKRFDYAIVFSKNASVQWINMKILDVFKAPGFGREKSIRKRLLILPEKINGELNPVAKMFELIKYDQEISKNILMKCLEALS